MRNQLKFPSYKRLIALLPLVAILASIFLAPSSSGATSKYLWNQEFNSKKSSKLDSKIWNYDIGDGSLKNLIGWGNNEQQYYTDTNAIIDGVGNLNIFAKRVVKPELKICYYGDCLFTSSRINTQGKFEFQYGRIETRIKMPAGEGTWPAFWALGSNIDTAPWPESGEIDFIETLGRTPRTVLGTIHGPGYSGANGISGEYTGSKSLAAAFHTYSVDWLPTSITWKIDGKVFQKVTKEMVSPNKWVFDQPFFLILNIAMGGNLGGFVPPEFKSPATMSVDYIRISKLNGYGKVTIG